MLRPNSWRLSSAILFLASCAGDGNGSSGTEGTENVGAFDGLFDGVGVGFNFPFDLAVVPDDPRTEDVVEGGDIFVANYGTSEIMRVADPSDGSTQTAMPFFDGTTVGLRGPTAVSIPNHEVVWATFEQGGTGDRGGVVVLDMAGELITLIDGAMDAAAFANPGGVCYGGVSDDGSIHAFFLVNLGDGTAWRIESPAPDGASATFTLVGSGLARGSTGAPGSPANGLSSSSDLPQGGARGCAYQDGFLYVADAQNARIVRFDDAHLGSDIAGVALEDTPPELVTYPTDIAINDEGFLIVISYDNAHAFVALEAPGGGFVDNGLHDLNVNAGNYGLALAHDTIWFTRANNQNGTLRAITPDSSTPPSTRGPFPPQ